MPKTIAFAVAFNELLYNGAALANVWDNAASSPLASLHLSAHLAAPGLNGDQTTNEAAYGSYARVAVARTSIGWAVDPTTGIVTPVLTVTFPTPTSGSGTITHIGIGRDASGAGFLFEYGTVSPAIVIAVGVAPQLTTASQVSEA